MDKVISFTVYGEPTAQGRPRAGKIQKGRNRGKTILYDPEKSKDYKEYVRLVASQYTPDKLLTGPLQLELHIFRPIPKSFSKKKQLAAEAGGIRPITKPDTDNYLKGISDALNKVIFNDDAQIVSVNVEKWYSHRPRVEIIIRQLEEAI